jgi:hypothetical protein
MKKFVSVSPRATSVAASIGLMLGVTLAVAFWFTTSPSGNAQTQCQLCHKRTQTISVTCGSVQYNGHLGHGDTVGACPVTPTENP